MTRFVRGNIAAFSWFGALLLTLAISSCMGTGPQPVPPSQEPVQSPPARPKPPAPTPEPPKPAPKPAADITSGNPIVKVRLFHGTATAALTAPAELQIDSNAKRTPLAPGTWQLTLAAARKPVQQFHVFAKTFRPGEEAQLQQYVADWKSKGFEAAPMLRGDRYQDSNGQLLDGRQYWVSLARAATEPAAQQIVKRLEAMETWAWVRAETIKPGTGTLKMTSASAAVQFALPLVLRCDAPLTVRAGEKHGTYTGGIELRVDTDGTLGVFEALPLEDYLAGVLPAEMPAEWPAEALKAQAVSARSDVLGHLGFKHILEGYHFTNSEGDRVYAGFGGRRPSTDAAVAATRGQVLVAGGRIVQAVFSSNCGGWTENNDSVWSSPPDPALRGTSDLSDSADPSDPSVNIANWLGRRPPAYCAADEKGFRWTRKFSPAQITAFVNKRYSVGAVTGIAAGDRGVSGRLKSVKITGTRGSTTVRKELPIRQVFGDLPSAMLIIKEERGPSGTIAWTFLGGGRGHGVGLCQHGARGMALKGFHHDAILKHYFSGSAVTIVQ